MGHPQPHNAVRPSLPPAAPPPTEAKLVFKGLFWRGCSQVSVYWPGVNLEFIELLGLFVEATLTVQFEIWCAGQENHTPCLGALTAQLCLWKISPSKAEVRVRMSYCSLAVWPMLSSTRAGLAQSEVRIHALPLTTIFIFITKTLFNVEWMPTEVAAQNLFEQNYKLPLSSWEPLACLGFSFFLSLKKIFYYFEIILFFIRYFFRLQK